LEILFSKLHSRKVVIMTFLIIVLNACGGGGDSSFSSSDSDTDTGTAQNIIPIDIYCKDTEKISTYIPLQSGNTITVVEGNPIVVTYHDSEGNKSVCLDPDSSGKASIIRQ